MNSSFNILPYNILAEKAILSILLTQPSFLDQVESYLPSESFYVNSNRVIYEALLELKKTTEIINLTTLITYLQDNNLLLEVGGITPVIDLIQRRESILYLKPYISLLNDKLVRRNLIALGEKLIEWGYLTHKPLEKILYDLENETFKVSQQHQVEKIYTTAEVLVETIDELKLSMTKKDTIGYKSQYLDLDAILQGFQNTDFIVLAGRPSMGKTALALNFAKNIAETYGKPVLVFSLEMSRKQIMFRFLALESLVDGTRLRLGKITRAEWIRVLQAAGKLSNLPLFIEDNSTISLSQIKAKIKQVHIEYEHIALVVIDYLQLIRVNIKLTNRVQEIAYITKTLKALAKEFDLPLLVLSQLSRGVEARVNKRPVLSDLRESGCLELNSWNSIVSYNGYFCKTLNNKYLIPINHYKLLYCFLDNSGLLKLSSNHKIYLTNSWVSFREHSYSIYLLLILNFTLVFHLRLLSPIVFNRLDIVKDLTIPCFNNFLLCNMLLHNSIEQDADVVLMIYREDYYKNSYDYDGEKDNIAEIIIAKHRNGPVGFVELLFESNINKFFSLS